MFCIQILQGKTGKHRRSNGVCVGKEFLHSVSSLGPIYVAVITIAAGRSR